MQALYIRTYVCMYVHAHPHTPLQQARLDPFPDPSRANAGRKGLVTLDRMLLHNGMQSWAHCIIACACYAS